MSRSVYSPMLKSQPIHAEKNRSREVRLLKKPYRLAELFCGCGGFSHGFALTSRFSVELGSDLSDTFCETFQSNHRRANGSPPLTIPGDIEKLSRAELPLAFRSLGYYQNGRLDVLLGGPPAKVLVRTSDLRTKTKRLAPENMAVHCCPS